MCFMMLTRFVNVRVHVNTGAKGNLVTAERDLNILQFEKAAETNRRVEVRLLYMFEITQMFSEIIIIG